MRRFAQVDVFGLRPFAGNPVAVVLDAEGLSTQDMQAMARWTNLSETTFVLPPSHAEASYRVRIFTPRQELPFAGHPSIGTAHAVLEAGLATPNAQGGLVQECAAGLLPLRIDMSGSQRQLFVRIPSARHQSLDAALQQQLSTALGADITPAECVNVGPTWIVAGLNSGAAVRALQPDLSVLAAQSPLWRRGDQRVRARCQRRSRSGRAFLRARRWHSRRSGLRQWQWRDCGLSAGEWRVAKSELLQQSGSRNRL